MLAVATLTVSVGVVTAVDVVLNPAKLRHVHGGELRAERRRGPPTPSNG